MDSAPPLATGPASENHSLVSLANIMQLLSEPVRLRVMLALADGEQNVTALNDRIPVPQASLSHHLGVLRMSKLVVARREGKFVCYKLASPAIEAETIRATADGFTVTISPLADRLTSSGAQRRTGADVHAQVGRDDWAPDPVAN